MFFASWPFETVLSVLDVARSATEPQTCPRTDTFMPLEFRRQRDGSLRDIWFGAFEINGKRYGINLGVKIAGTPPASLSIKDKGDTDYDNWVPEEWLELTK